MASGERPSAPRGGLHAAVAAAGRALLDLALPLACVSCDALMSVTDRGIVCGVCWSRLDLLAHPQCIRCGTPADGHSCRGCRLLPAYVRAARSVCWMTPGPAPAIVHALKYEGWTAAAAGMAERMTRLSWPRDVSEERAAVVPVPLSPIRIRERGYNQSLLLARPLADRWSVPVWDDVLERTRSTATQTQLTPGERRANVAGAFRAGEAARSRLRGAHVIVVDDVVTTAATLNACAEALVAGGARIVSYLTFGRARGS